MCIPALITGGVLSAGGQLLQRQQANKQAAAIARARNEELRKTLAKNDEIAARTRATFGERTAGYDDDQFAESEQKAIDMRSAPLEEAVSEVDVPTPISGSAPEVVRSELARVMSDTMAKGKAQAKALAKVGSYGDTWFNQGVANNSASRDVGVENDYAAGNLAILPYLQDYAEIEAMKPMSPLGGILQGAGNLIGSAGGNGRFSFLQKKPVPKVMGLPMWGGPR